MLKDQGIKKIDNFRADAASYQFDVIQLLEAHVNHFYIGVRTDYVGGYFPQITNWQESKDSTGEKIWIGDTTYTRFIKQYKAKDGSPKSYRLLVKKKPNKDGQINLITQDAFDYRAMITNNAEGSTQQLIAFYNKRGAMERQFDILKNDFGWKNMPFSSLAKNNVFLILMAICRNIYHCIIQRIAKRSKNVKANFRIKRFIFTFIILPAKWSYRSRQKVLNIYGSIAFKT